MAGGMTLKFVNKGIAVFSLKLNVEAESFGSNDTLDNQRGRQ